MRISIFRNDADHSASLWLKSCALLSLLSTAALYISLPIPHSMALRNVLLLLSFISGIVLIVRSGSLRRILCARPIGLLLLLLAWVTLHATCLSANGGEAWEELWGQWYKPYLAMVGGIGCALSAGYVQRKFWASLLVGALMVLPFWFVAHSVVVWIMKGGLINQYIGLFVHKLGFVPFVEIMAAFAFTRLSVHAKTGMRMKMAIWLLPVVASYYIALITDTKNSLLLLTVMSLVFILRMALRRPQAADSRHYVALVMVIFFVAVAGIYGSLQKSAQWASFISDAKVAIDIDGIHNWENRTKYGLPNNAQNVAVSESTYLRIAYAVAGVREIVQHPLGYGVTRHAFERLVQQRNQEAKIANSHSGYIDLIAAVGVPALILLLAAEISLLKQAYRSVGEHGYMIWILGMIMLHWVVDPLSRDQHVYALFLLMGYFSISVMQQKGADSLGNLRTG